MIPDKEKVLDRNGFDFEAFEYESEYSAKNILAAMDEYGKHIAIGFTKWVVDEDYIPVWPHNTVGDKWRNADGKEYTTGQLFDQYLTYLQSINIKQQKP